MKKIYFAGSIRGGREDAGLYEEIIAVLAEFGEVLTEHVGNAGLRETGEDRLSDSEIYMRDLDWLKHADLVVAEVSTPSLGVGFEIATALALKIEVVCLYREQEGKRLSAMIAGCPEVEVLTYRNPAECMDLLRQRMK
jgi:nucleoside 2-deoxyribosyltransferase